MILFDVKRLVRLFKHRLDAMISAGSTPAPYLQKHALLRDFFPPHSIAIETGTYLGETTRVLSLHCARVISFEPHVPLYAYNTERFSKVENVQIVNQASEEGLVPALEGLAGDVSFWLDGHFSGEGTHGTNENASPILKELESIGEWLRDPSCSAFVAIDDARLFDGTDGYPTESQVRDFANRHALSFIKLRDIFFLKRNDT